MRETLSKCFQWKRHIELADTQTVLALSLYIYMLANTRYAQFKWRMEASDAQNKYDLMSDELENISVESTKTEDSLQNNTKWSYSKCI